MLQRGLSKAHMRCCSVQGQICDFIHKTRSTWTSWQTANLVRVLCDTVVPYTAADIFQECIWCVRITGFTAVTFGTTYSTTLEPSTRDFPIPTDPTQILRSGQPPLWAWPILKISPPFRPIHRSHHKKCK